MQISIVWTHVITKGDCDRKDVHKNFKIFTLFKALGSVINFHMEKSINFYPSV